MPIGTGLADLHWIGTGLADWHRIGTGLANWHWIDRLAQNWHRIGRLAPDWLIGTGLALDMPIKSQSETSYVVNHRTSSLYGWHEVSQRRTIWHSIPRAALRCILLPFLPTLLPILANPMSIGIVPSKCWQVNKAKNDKVSPRKAIFTPNSIDANPCHAMPITRLHADMPIHHQFVPKHANHLQPSHIIGMTLDWHQMTGHWH